MPNPAAMALLQMLQAVMNVTHGPAHLKTRAGYLYHSLTKGRGLSAVA